jgi:hypothetical protein
MHQADPPAHCLFQDINELVSRMVAADNRFLVFSDITNQLKKMYKFISNRQLNMKGKFILSHKQKKHVEQKQAEFQKTQEPSSKERILAHQEMPSALNLKMHSTAELGKQHHFKEDDRELPSSLRVSTTIQEQQVQQL